MKSEKNMPRKISFAPAFDEDLSEIREYLRNNDFDVAITSHIIDEIIDRLTKFPKFGRVYERNPKYRSFIVKKRNVVFYRIVDDEEILVLRIRAGSQKKDV